MNQHNALISIENIGPREAEAYLAEAIPNQRQVRRYNVDRIAQDMDSGHFRLTSDAILLIKGRLANGQHRLRAVVKSGVTCAFLVMRTDDERVFQVIDGGTPRRASDYILSTDSLTAAGAAKLVLQHEVGKLHSGGGSGITRTQQIEYAVENAAKLEEAIRFVTPLYNQNRLFSKVLSVALIEIARVNGLPQADQFIAALYLGNSDDAAKDFRERMILNCRSKTKLPRAHIIALMIKSFKSYTSGTRPAVLKFSRDEEFPTLKAVA